MEPNPHRVTVLVVGLCSDGDERELFRPRKSFAESTVVELRRCPTFFQEISPRKTFALEARCAFHGRFPRLGHTEREVGFGQVMSGLLVIRPPRDTPTPGGDFLFGDSSLRNTPALQSSGARVKITGARNTTDRVPRRRREGGAKGSVVLGVRTMTIRL
jgi:hypothetical protein